MIFKIILCFIFFIYFSITVLSQNDGVQSNTEPFIGSIFGEEKLIKYGADTIRLNSQEQIIYSCSQCSIFCISKNGLTKWTIDLSTYGCKLIAFKRFHSKLDKPPSGCDIIIQFKDKKIYGIKSKNGRLKKLKDL